MSLNIMDLMKKLQGKNYEIQEKIEQEDDKLYKLKGILDMYPMLTTYSVNKAVNEKRLTATQLGKTIYYKKRDIEKYLESNQKKSFQYKRY